MASAEVLNTIRDFLDTDTTPESGWEQILSLPNVTGYRRRRQLREKQTGATTTDDSSTNNATSATSSTTDSNSNSDQNANAGNKGKETTSPLQMDMFKVEDYEFKIVAEFNSIRADILSQVYVDLDYRMIWDPNMVNWEQLDNQCLLFTTKYPFPLQSREYIYSMCRQQVHVDGRVFYVMIVDSASDELAGTVGRTAGGPTGNITSGFGPRQNLNAAATSPTGSAPPTVRVWEFSQQIAVSATEDGAGSRVVLTYHENPNGPVPNFFYNWAVKAGVPGFIKNLHDACLKYVPPL